MCVCVCVCVWLRRASIPCRKKERKREMGKDRGIGSGRSERSGAEVGDDGVVRWYGTRGEVSKVKSAAVSRLNLRLIPLVT